MNTADIAAANRATFAATLIGARRAEMGISPIEVETAANVTRSFNPAPRRRLSAEEATRRICAARGIDFDAYLASKATPAGKVAAVVANVIEAVADAIVPVREVELNKGGAQYEWGF